MRAASANKRTMDAMDRDDDRLLERFVAGDPDAFVAFYRLHLPAIVGWLRRRTGDPEVTADLCAETFCAALLAAPRYRPDKGSALNWLYGIAAHKLADSRRRGVVESRARRRLGLPPLQIEDEDLARVEELASLHDGAEPRLEEALAQLPAAQRDAIFARVVEEQPYGEIATQMQTSEMVVRQRVARGLRTLPRTVGRARMSPFFDDLERQLRTAATEHPAHRPWWRRPRNLALLAVAGLGLGTPAVARVSGVWDPGIEPPSRAGTAVTVSASASSSCKEREPAKLPAGARLDPALVARLAVLRRPQRAGDERPAPAAGTGGEPIADPKSSRYVGSVAGRSYFLVAATSRTRTAGCGKPSPTKRLDLCLFAERGGGGCGLRAKDLQEHGMVLSSLTANNRSVVVGVVPDGVVEVTLRYGTSERSFTVKDNFYGFEVAAGPDRQPDAEIWTLRDGTRRNIR